ncbi:MAG: hypothetical protein ACOCP8_05490 [archaeon]
MKTEVFNIKINKQLDGLRKVYKFKTPTKDELIFNISLNFVNPDGYIYIDTDALSKNNKPYMLVRFDDDKGKYSEVSRYKKGDPITPYYTFDNTYVYFNYLGLENGMLYTLRNLAYKLEGSPETYKATHHHNEYTYIPEE